MPINSRRQSLRALLRVTAAAVLTATPFPSDARAEGRGETATVSASEHNAVFHVPAGGVLPVTRRVRIARNKTMLLVFPYELRDVMVSAPDIVDAVVQSSSHVHLIGRDKVGQSSANFFDSTGRLALTLDVTVERDVTELEATFREVLVGSRIKVRILNDTAILTGTVPTPLAANRASDIAARFIARPDDDGRSARKVVNLLAIEAEEQVMLHVTVAEVQRTALKQFGINLGALINSGSFSTSILTDNALPLTTAQGLGKLAAAGVTAAGDVKLNAAGSEPLTNSGAATSWRSGNQQGSATVRALERMGLVKTLAEPTLTAVSGEPAKFLVGGEYPVTTVDNTGKQSVVFKEYGVALAFTPMVLAEGRISLKIETEVSELTSEGAVTLSSISIQALKKRQAKSTIELPSGGALAIAGLISESVKQNLDGVPGLKDVPVLGTLFRSRDFVRSETELVVVVTPYIVRATAARHLARPDQGLAPASDAKANLLGHFNRVYGGVPKDQAGTLDRDPFIVD